MSVHLDGKIIRLDGACPVEDAETLLGLLQLAPGRLVDMSAAEHLHAAVVQVLLAFRPPVSGAPADAFVVAWLAPLLERPGP
jgi:hypothetical protein